MTRLLMITAGCVAALAVAYSQQAPARIVAAAPGPMLIPAAESPRYQMIVEGDRVFRIDTFTGRMWERVREKSPKLDISFMMPIHEEGDPFHQMWLDDLVKKPPQGR
jgi:hypothetical protein